MKKFLIFCGILGNAYCQGVCKFVNSQNLTSSIKSNPSPFFFINNFSANKCFRIGNFGHYPSNVFLDECFWGASNIKLIKDEKIYFRNNSLVSDGLTIYNDAGLGESYCLSLAKDGFLKTEICKSGSWDQAWRLKPVRGHEFQFQIQQVSSSLCMIPQSRTTNSLITLNSCNAYQTEQLWKLCVASK